MAVRTATGAEDYMWRCLELARKGSGRVSPNPLVGAVLVYRDRIIGEGWHAEYGGAHAEVNCLQSVSPDDRPLISESRLFVSLEPCAHYGQTPPCVDLILEHRIPEVVIGCKDTFSQVAGKGIRQLQAASVKVTTGVLQEACRKINRRFFTRQEKGRPYIILKWAESADGYLAPENGAKVAISGPGSQKLVHKMRKTEDAFLIGYRTAVLDNPLLTDRFWGGPQPVKIIWDRDDALPLDLQLLQEGMTYILNGKENRQEGQFHKIKIEQPLPDPSWFSQETTGKLNSVVVEGGWATLQAFIDTGLWDEAWVFRASEGLSAGLSAPKLKQGRRLRAFKLGPDGVNVWAHEDNGFYV